MKRREFIIGAAGVATSAWSGIVRGQSSPCPPPTMAIGGGSSLATSCGPSAPSAAPKWFLDMPEMHWTEVATGVPSTEVPQWKSGSTIRQVRFMHDGKDFGGHTPVPNVTGYSGGTVDQSRGMLLVMGGGHGGYRGNEVYGLDLRSERPSWRIEVTASPGAIDPSGDPPYMNYSGQYPRDEATGNGWPESSHTSNGPKWTKDGRLWLPLLWGVQRAGSDSPSPGTSSYFFCDLRSKTWTRVGKAIPDEIFAAGGFGGTVFEGCASVYIEERDEIWVSLRPGATTAISLYRIDVGSGAVTGRWVNGAASRSWGRANAVSIPAVGTRPQVVLIGSASVYYQGVGLYLFDPRNPGTPVKLTKVLNASGLPFPGGNATYNSMHYHAAANGGHGAVYATVAGDSEGLAESFVKLSIPKVASFADLATAEWVAERVDPANLADPGRTVVPPEYGSPAKLYSRFNLVRDMGNGQAAIVYLMNKNVAGPTHIFKLPMGGA